MLRACGIDCICIQRPASFPPPELDSSTALVSVGCGVESAPYRAAMMPHPSAVWLGVCATHVWAVWVSRVPSITYLLDCAEDVGHPLEIASSPRHGSCHTPSRRSQPSIRFPNARVAGQVHRPESNGPCAGLPTAAGRTDVAMFKLVGSVNTADLPASFLSSSTQRKPDSSEASPRRLPP